MQYLLIPEIKIQRANIRQGSWLASPLAIMASHLLAHAIGRDTGIFPEAHAYIHHNHRYNVEEILDNRRVRVFNHETKASGIMRGNESKTPSGAANPPIMTGDFTVSIILQYKDSAPNPIAIEQSLLNRRLAGGAILRFGKISVWDELHGEKGLLKFLPFGYATIERTDLLAQGENRIETLHSLVMKKTGTKKEKTPYYAPCALGYSTITEITQRKNVRGNYPHAFADTLIGLVELKPTSKLSPQDPIFWTGSWEQTQNLQSYLIKTKP